MTANTTSKGQSMMSVERATELLHLFSETDSADLGVTEIAKQLDLSKAVVHRLLTSLRGREFVVLDEVTRRYRLGTGSLLLGLAALERLDVRGLARPAIEALSEQTGETATLSIRSGNQRIYVDQCTPAREVKMTVRIGNPWPLHAGASSKAFLAFLPPDQIDEYLANDLDKVTDATVVDPADVRRDLEATRTRGYAASFSERLAGAASVAAPIFDHGGDVVGVMSVCGPRERFQPAADESAAVLMTATRDVSRKLGYKPPMG